MLNKGIFLNLSVVWKPRSPALSAVRFNWQSGGHPASKEFFNLGKVQISWLHQVRCQAYYISRPTRFCKAIQMKRSRSSISASAKSSDIISKSLKKQPSVPINVSGRWLMKSEPDCFSIDNLLSRSNSTETWDGGMQENYIIFYWYVIVISEFWHLFFYADLFFFL